MEELKRIIFGEHRLHDLISLFLSRVLHRMEVDCEVSRTLLNSIDLDINNYSAKTIKRMESVIILLF